MPNFIESIKTHARANKRRIVLPEGGDIRTLEAANKILRGDFAELIIIGEKAKIPQNLDLSKAEIVDISADPHFDEYADLLCEIRKSKGLSLDEAKQLLQDPLYYGVMMVKTGRADGMVAGAASATSAVLRPSLQILKTAPGVKLVSSFFLMVMPDSSKYVFSDCGLCIDPTAEELAEIAISSAESYKTLVGESRVWLCCRIQP